MNRRDALRMALAAGVAGLAPRPLLAEGDGPRVMTVRGPIAPEAMGTTLPHEHVLVDFIGADRVSRDRYRADEAFGVAPPNLSRIVEQGVRTLVECTPAYVGRDPALLLRLSGATGLNILTPTGYYGASRGKFLPDHARTESADDLASRWLREWREGIEGTGIPGPASSSSGPTPGRCRRSTASSSGPRPGSTGRAA